MTKKCKEEEEEKTTNKELLLNYQITSFRDWSDKIFLSSGLRASPKVHYTHVVVSKTIFMDEIRIYSGKFNKFQRARRTCKLSNILMFGH
jgi:hypothetical protein